MTSITQANTDRARAPSGADTGLDSSTSSQNPSSGHDITGTGRDYATGLGTGIESGIGTGKTGYSSSPLAQQQGTTTCQYDSSRSGEEGIEGGTGQKQYGRGTGTGVGHHIVHQEGHLHGHGPGEAAKANCESCTRDQAAGRTQLGQDTGETVTEPTIKSHPGVDPTGATTTGYGTGTQTGYLGDTTGHRAGVPITSSGAGTDSQYLADTTEHHGRHHKHHHGGNDDHGVTGTGVKPSMTDKIIGGVEKAAGKVTSNTGMYQRGEERAAGETAAKKN